MSKLLEKWKSDWEKEKERLKPMTTAQRIDHLWTYYKEYLMVVAVLLLVVIAVISSIINAGKETVVSGKMVNISISQEGYNYMSADYAEDLGINEKKQEVFLSYSQFSSLSDAANTEQNYNAAMTLIAEVSAQMLDYMIMDKAAMEFYVSQDVYMNLREFFTQEELDQLGETLVYAQEEGSDEKWIVAVDITDTAYVQRNVTSEGKVYFALSGSSQHPEMCRDAWERINNWPAEE